MIATEVSRRLYLRVMHICSSFDSDRMYHWGTSFLSTVLILACLAISGCGTTADPRWAVAGWVDRKNAQADAKQSQVCDYFSIGPVSGRGWLLYHKDSSNVIIRADEGKHSHYELNAFTIQLSNSFVSWQQFAAYVQDRRTPKSVDWEILDQSFYPSQRFGTMEVGYYVKCRFTKDGQKYAVQSRGYDFVHPTSPKLHINLAYNEVHQKDETNSVRSDAAEEFFMTFRTK